MKKEKQHKPWCKKDIGKTLMFYREADRSEIPEPEKKKEPQIQFMSSGSAVFHMSPIKKDRGVLVRVEVTATHEQYNTGCDCYDDDCDCTPKYETRTRRFYEYRFKVNGCLRTTNSRTMENGINGRWLLEEKKPTKKTGKK